jgi:hypothetical protein
MTEVTPTADEWLAAQNDHVRGLFWERGFPEPVKIELLEVPLEVYREWITMAPVDDYLERMISAIKLGLLTAPPMMGESLIDGQHRLTAHVLLETPQIPVYFVRPA